MQLIDIFGYVSSLVILASYLMKDITKLRIFTSIGCVMFVFYGFMLDAIPVVVMNVSVIIINLYFLIKKK